MRLNILNKLKPFSYFLLNKAVSTAFPLSLTQITSKRKKIKIILTFKFSGSGYYSVILPLCAKFHVKNHLWYLKWYVKFSANRRVNVFLAIALEAKDNRLFLPRSTTNNKVLKK